MALAKYYEDNTTIALERQAERGTSTGKINYNDVEEFIQSTLLSNGFSPDSYFK